MDRKLPGTFQQLMNEFPEVAAAHERMAEAVDKIGTLDQKTCALIKIGISVGAGLESALRSHVRRALDAGRRGKKFSKRFFKG